jgi:hypothetical protein
MTTYYSPEMQQPVRPRKKRGWVRKAIIPAATLFLGIGMGAASAGGGGGQEPAAAPTPAPTVTQTVEVPGPVQTKEVEVTKEVKVTPAVCKVALDYADEGFTNFAEILQAINDGISTGDFSAAAAGNEKVTKLAPKYNAAKAACRATVGATS